VTTTIEECGIVVEFKDSSFTIRDEYNELKDGDHKITLTLNDLKVLETIFEHYHKLKEIK
jgi:DNA-binding winged helix-turn-helix (wHTH) protein